LISLSQNETAMKAIYVHLAEGFEEIEAITVIDVLRRAGLNVITVSVTENNVVTGSHKIPVRADILFKDADYEQAEMIILPGGMPGAKNLSEHEGLNNEILNFFKQGKLLGAICAAPMVLGNLGILKGKNVVCYPGFESYLEGANVKQSSVVKDGKIITGRGPGVALQFSLEIVNLLKDEETALKLKKSMVVEV
jgi:4-methyl-5(b-hydroxyethyl)-thiazole monophosphate biosynthesis